MSSCDKAYPITTPTASPNFLCSVLGAVLSNQYTKFYVDPNVRYL
ncbi:14476_t:CDS:2 [Racocetra fulgida]|uniref:14476_t:CDS:1 n=1 Tax=Racocetra fulgida TaxID=60492 RepID=A0A9N8Z4Q1_9GLOM|nr:14476_t:CDS:2 [Racocetra fulgida]